MILYGTGALIVLAVPLLLGLGIFLFVLWMQAELSNANSEYKRIKAKEAKMKKQAEESRKEAEDQE